MKITQVDNKSFGTRPMIGYIAANDGLSKYSIELTNGIIDSFEKLSKNGINDQLRIDVGHKNYAKRRKTDSFEVSLWLEDRYKIWRPKSSTAFSPKKLEKMSANQISNLILKSYKKLVKSYKIDTKGTDLCTLKQNKSISDAHKDEINQLVSKFGYYDGF